MLARDSCARHSSNHFSNANDRTRSISKFPLAPHPLAPSGIAGRNSSLRPNAFFKSCSGRNAFVRSRIAERAVPGESPNLLSMHRSSVFASMGWFLITARTPSGVLIVGTCRPKISTKNSFPRFRARAFLTTSGTGLNMPSRRRLD